MKNCYFKGSLLLLLLISLSAATLYSPDWGFYGHRKINRMAVFTLPPDLIGFFKQNIEYVTEHSVDPDKRRYSTKFEAVRHYIDIDHWGVYPFDNVPRDWHDAILQYADFRHVNGITGDTTLYKWPCNQADSTMQYEVLNIDCEMAHVFYAKYIQPIFYTDEQFLDLNKINADYKETSRIIDQEGELLFVDHFSEYGVLPYHLKQYYQQLVKAYESKNSKKILRLCAEIGHYIGDAHVPLHTTENYNGQFTDQIGIHAFWESRLPELFADDSYDFFVGRADYIDQVGPYFWDIVLKSHEYLPQVLDQEKDLSILYPQDQQFCFEERLEVSVRTQCEAYAGAYHQSLDGMVEQRMQDAVLSIGSVWYSAWIDAGSPDLGNLPDNILAETEQDSLDIKFNKGRLFGRDHSN